MGGSGKPRESNRVIIERRRRGGARRFVWGWKEGHVTKGRAAEELMIRVSVRLPESLIEERGRVYDELLHLYGDRTVKSLGEFDREVYRLGLGRVLADAAEQAKAKLR